MIRITNEDIHLEYILVLKEKISNLESENSMLRAHLHDFEKKIKELEKRVDDQNKKFQSLAASASSYRGRLSSEDQSPKENH